MAITNKIGSGSDTLILKITQDAYQGNAQYAVFVDGKQVGSTFTADALHGSGQFDTLEIKGDWGVGNHNVSVKLLNDLYHGTPQTDRNVYVESATYNGAAVADSYRYVNSTDAKSFTVADKTAVPATPTPAPTPGTGVVTKVGSGSDTLTLKISQDAYQGDAQYAVFVDGKQVGGTFTAKALHGGSQFDTLEIKGDWGVGNHNVSVKLLNDLYHGTPQTDRNVYVESATYNGAAVTDSYRYVNSTDAKTFVVNDATAIPGAGTPAPTPTPTPTPTPAPSTGIKLTKTTAPIKSTAAGQVIENQDIWVDSGNAVTITHDNVILKNCRIHHKGGDGVHITNAKNVQILNCEIVNSDPPVGLKAETSENIRNVYAYNSSGLKVQNVTLRDGSTGVYLDKSPGAVIDHIDGYNFHGPFPRGQLVQFGNSPDGKLTNFYVHNDLKNSWTEDNINVYHSKNVLIENGVVDGNNSPSGVGVLFEGASDGGIVRNVDVIHQSNGGFSSYSNNVDFIDVRVFDGYNTDIGRGKAMSNGLSFAIDPGTSGVSYDDATYTRPANAGNIAWDVSKAEFVDIKEDKAASPMAHVTNDWNWIV